MNWDEYNWYFNRDIAPSEPAEDYGETTTTPWTWATTTSTCIGSACCYDGSTYDSEKNMCIPNAVYNKKSDTTESFVSGEVLGKYAGTQIKPTYINNFAIPNYPSS
jgi:hypothetical protein